MLYCFTNVNKELPIQMQALAHAKERCTRHRKPFHFESCHVVTTLFCTASLWEGRLVHSWTSVTLPQHLRILHLVSYTHTHTHCKHETVVRSTYLGLRHQTVKGLSDIGSMSTVVVGVVRMVSIFNQGYNNNKIKTRSQSKRAKFWSGISFHFCIMARQYL